MSTKNTLLDLIESSMLDKSMSPAELSRLAVGNPYLIYNLRKKGFDPRYKTLKGLCHALGLEFYIGTPRDSAASNAVPNTNLGTPHIYKESPSGDIPKFGDIAAGGNEHPADGQVYMQASDSYDTTHSPVGLLVGEDNQYGGLFALTVKGKSMEPIYSDGSTIYLYKDDPLRFNAEKLIGKDCAITLTEEHNNAVYLKRLRWPDNRKKGYFNLESLNRSWDTMVDIPIYSALPVRYTKHKL